MSFVSYSISLTCLLYKCNLMIRKDSYYLIIPLLCTEINSSSTCKTSICFISRQILKKAFLVLFTACLSGAAKLARRQRGEKKYSPRERGRKLEHRAMWWLILPTFFFFSYTILTSTERGASAVENFGSPRYQDRQ